MEQFNKGVALESKPVRFLMRMTLISIIKNEYQNAQSLIEQVMSMDLPARVSRMAYGLQVNLFQRKAEFLARNADYNSSLAELKNIKQLCNSKRSQIDKQAQKHIDKSRFTARNCLLKIDDIEIKNDTNDYIFWAENYSSDTTDEIGDKDLTGEVMTLKIKENYGFIESERGNKYFFHKGEVVDPTIWENDLISKSVIFDTKKEKKGDTAINIRLLE